MQILAPASRFQDMPEEDRTMRMKICLAGRGMALFILFMRSCVSMREAEGKVKTVAWHTIHHMDNETKQPTHERC